MRHRRLIITGAVFAAAIVGVAFFHALEYVVIPNPLQGDFRVLQPATENSAHIIFTGDVFLGRDVERRMDNRGTAATLSLFNDLPETDALIVNFEAAIPEVHQPTPDFGWQFSVRSDIVAELAAVGVTHVGLANNHTFDHGSAGYAHTRQTLTSVGIESFGHPSRINHDLSVSSIETEFGSIAVVGMHTLYGVPSLRSIDDTIASIEPTPERIVAYVHWGEEYELEHNAQQRAFAEQLVDLGFDLIVGHHPHVVQGIEMIGEVPVVYSLGNTIFDQYFSTDVQQGLLLSYTASSDGDALEFVPITSLGTPAAPRFMESENAADFLQDVASRGSELVAPAVSWGQLEW